MLNESRQGEHAVTAAKKVMIVVFAALIGLPLCDSLFKLDRTRYINENRMLASFPKLVLSTDGFRSFFSGLDNYYNDHFGFRGRLINWAHAWKRAWFNESLQSGVVIGQKGWLFSSESVGVKTGSDRVKSPFTDEELKGWSSLFESRRDWLQRRGIHYLVVVPPDKQTIYPEFLPGSAKPDSVAKLDQFMTYMANHTSVPILDLRGVLTEAKQRRLVYLLTDSHWNQFGAFVACNEIMRSMSQWNSELRPLSLDMFDLTFTNQMGGNLAWMLAGADSMIEREAPLLTPRQPLPVLEVRRTDTNWAVVHHVQNPAMKGAALVFCDSFAEGLLPFMGHFFRDVWLYRVYDGKLAANPQDEAQRAHVWVPALIQEKKPDIVIDEILESLLYLEDPGQILEKDALH